MNHRKSTTAPARALFAFALLFLFVVAPALTSRASTEAADAPKIQQPAAADRISPTASGAGASETAASRSFLPLLVRPRSPIGPPLPPPTPFKGDPPLNFDEIAVTLQAQGLALAYNKIGFHAGDRGRWRDLIDMMTRLDAAGVPFFLKSTDNAQPIYIAQELMRKSGVPHTLVYRRVSGVDNVPNYNASPAEAARYHWEQHRDIFPPELDPALVWVETVNEVDKNRAAWLGEFAWETAQLTLADGFRWAAFGWSSGEPEPKDWESPAMLRFLRLAGDNPDRLAIALHEYSYETDNIGHVYPYLVGRFQFLFDACDRYDIARPTVLITEWGWTYNNLPAEPDAMEDVTWAARLYGAYPQVKGAAIWNLGRLGDRLLPLNDQAQDLIDNMMVFSLDSYFSAPALPQLAPLDPAQFPPPK